MCSIGPYSTITSYSHKYYIPDIKKYVTYNQNLDNNSIYNTILNDPRYSFFRHIIHLAKYEHILNDIVNTNITLLLPSNESLIENNKNEAMFINMDRSIAIQVIKYCIIPDRINSMTFKNYPYIYFNSLNNTSKLFIRNNNNVTTINENIKVLKFDIVCDNGFIVLVSDLPIPYII